MGNYKNREITRIKHDGMIYILGVTVDQISLFNEYYEVASPWFHITTKSSIKKQGKLTDKIDQQFKSLSSPINNPISLYNKIYKIFKDFLSRYEYIHVHIYNDDQEEKRKSIYLKSLKKMGLNVIYIYKNEYILSKTKLKIKHKTLNKILEELYF